MITADEEHVLRTLMWFEHVPAPYVATRLHAVRSCILRGYAQRLPSRLGVTTYQITDAGFKALRAKGE